MARADSPTKNRYGNIRRVIRTVSSPAAGLAKKPGAMSRTSQGAARMPEQGQGAQEQQHAPRPRRGACAACRRGTACVTYSVNTGMKGGRERALGKEAAQQIGYAEGHEEGVGHAAPAPKK